MAWWLGPWIFEIVLGVFSTVLAGSKASKDISTQYPLGTTSIVDFVRIASRECKNFENVGPRGRQLLK